MTAISITEVTSGSIEGTGAFDKIMTAMQIRLEKEFEQGRITGDDYANVYLGAMTASMQQAVAFVLGKQTADAQADLIKAQTAEVNAQTLNVQADTVNKGKQGTLLDQQKLEVIAQTANITADTANKAKQGLLLEQQRLEVVAQIANITADTANKPKQGVLLDKQALETTARTTNVTADTSNKTKEGTVLDRQATKLTAEELLIKHKSVNEQAQRSDTVTEVTGGALVVSGVIGKQKTLYQAQTDGFARDAEQKLAKILVDTWNVRRTTDSAVSAAGTGLEDTNIKSVIDKAKQGIGI